MPPIPVCPIPPKCSTYFDGATRCGATATVWLVAPDGKPNPGGYLCQRCGARIVAEYAAKLGEFWTLHPIPTE